MALLDESDLCLSDSTVEAIVDNVIDDTVLLFHQWLILQDLIFTLNMYFVALCLDLGLQTFSQADSNGDGKIDPEEWKEFVKKNPAALRNMSLPYLQ